MTNESKGAGELVCRTCRGTLDGGHKATNEVMAHPFEAAVVQEVSKGAVERWTLKCPSCAYPIEMGRGLAPMPVAPDTGREVTSLSDEEIAKEVNALWYRGEMPRIVATLAEIPMLRRERDALRAELHLEKTLRREVKRQIREASEQYRVDGWDQIADAINRLIKDLFTEADDGE